MEPKSICIWPMVLATMRCEGAAPAGVDGGDDSLFGIDHEDGSAVGGADAEQQAGAFGGEGVAFALLGGRVVIEDADDVGVDLVERDQGEIAGAERGLEAAFVFFDVFAGVPFDRAEVQDFFAVEVADAAGAGAEAVDEPGDFVEGGGLGGR